LSSPTEKRLNKYISDSGFCSRREADRLIEQNRVTINGKKPELGTKVQPGDVVNVDGKPIAKVADNKSDRIYIAYNKPVGIICITDTSIKDNIIDAIGYKQRIFPIGRIDKPSEGLIFLTNDGDIVNKILRAENAHDKEYVVTVDKPITESFIKHMSKGVPILGTITDPCKVSKQSKTVFNIVLTQGLNRQIRRMCEYLGYEVVKLKRVRIMNVELDNLKPGQWRHLTQQEMQEINQSVAGSSKTATKRSRPKAQNLTKKEYFEIQQDREAKKAEKAEQSAQEKRPNREQTPRKHHQKSESDIPESPYKGKQKRQPIESAKPQNPSKPAKPKKAYEKPKTKRTLKLNRKPK